MQKERVSLVNPSVLIYKAKYLVICSSEKFLIFLFMHIAEHIHTNRYRKSRAGIPHGNISINQSKITNPAILQNLFLDLNNPKYIV